MSMKKADLDLYKEYASTIDRTLPKQASSISLYSIVKRMMDVLISVIGLAVTAPILVLVIILIKLESPGAAIYKQVRVGQNGKYFEVLKLRSMVINAEKNGAQWAKKNDPRVTRIGAFIRKTRIDELPQFINVLKGEMSVIGPRPERPSFTAEFNREIPGFVERLTVKPGLTGWAQVNGGYDITPKEKFTLDMYYIKNANLLLDLKIILKTFRVVLTGEGAR